MRHDSRWVAVLAMSVLACSGDTTGTSPGTTSADVFSVGLNEHAINLSLTGSSSTMQLIATALNAHGEAISIQSQPIFQSADSSITVTPSGLVTAHYVTTSGAARVVVTLQQNHLILTDTAFIRVTATMPTAIATFSIQPLPGDSAVGYISEQYAPVVTATDVDGNPIPFSTPGGGDTYYWLTTSNSTVANCSHCQYGYMDLQDTGHVTLYASAWVYGREVKDSLPFLIGWNPTQYIIYDPFNFPLNPFSPNTTFLLVGGVVNLQYYDANDYTGIDVVFDDSTAVDSAIISPGQSYTGSGNLHLPPTEPADKVVQVRRRFPVAGTYHYHVVQHPTFAGTIFVLKNPVQ